MATAKKNTKVELMVSPDSDKESKAKALKTAIAQIEKKHGEGSVMRLGENSRMEVQAVSRESEKSTARIRDICFFIRTSFIIAKGN